MTGPMVNAWTDVTAVPPVSSTGNVRPARMPTTPVSSVAQLRNVMYALGISTSFPWTYDIAGIWVGMSQGIVPPKSPTRSVTIVTPSGSIDVFGNGLVEQWGQYSSEYVGSVKAGFFPFSEQGWLDFLYYRFHPVRIFGTSTLTAYGQAIESRFEPVYSWWLWLKALEPNVGNSFARFDAANWQAVATTKYDATIARLGSTFNASTGSVLPPANPAYPEAPDPLVDHVDTITTTGAIPDKEPLKNLVNDPNYDPANRIVLSKDGKQATFITPTGQRIPAGLDTRVGGMADVASMMGTDRNTMVIGIVIALIVVLIAARKG